MTTTTDDYREILERRQAKVEEVNRANGWYDTDRTLGEGIALLHSEVSEALEAYRRWELVDPTPAGWSVLSDDGTTYATGKWLAGVWIPGTYEDAEREADLLRVEEPGAIAVPTHKPEGVGSEIADVLIRLLDEAGRQGIPLTQFSRTQPDDMRGRVGDGLAAIHQRISQAHIRPDEYTFGQVYAALVGFCQEHRIHLANEYARKIAFNRTRGHRHGGRHL